MKELIEVIIPALVGIFAGGVIVVLANWALFGSFTLEVLK
jgi:hypothetical protein